MKTKTTLQISILLFVSFCFSQTNFLCPNQTVGFKIENEVDVPSVLNNGDGTVTLTHPESYITDIFSEYVILDFWQVYPTSSSENLRKNYAITCLSKDLIVDLIDTVPNTIFNSYVDYNLGANFSYTPLETELITFLDDKTLKLKQSIYTDEYGCSVDCPLQDVPEYYDLYVEFDYLLDSDNLIMQLVNNTPCGNNFSIKFKGGNSNDLYDPNNYLTLQTWEMIPILEQEIDFSIPPCNDLEWELYTLLNISCQNSAYGNIKVTIDEPNSAVNLYREHSLFGYHEFRFEEDNLSLNDFEVLQNIIVFEKQDNPYLQISNNRPESLEIEIYAISGQQTVSQTDFKEQSIRIDHLKSGIYFIRLSNDSGNSITTKFLKR